MYYVRIRSLRGGVSTGIDQLYIGDDQVRAINRFRKEYPEHNDCIVVASIISDNDPEYLELVDACRRCGCINW